MVYGFHLTDMEQALWEMSSGSTHTGEDGESESTRQAFPKSPYSRLSIYI